MAIGLQICMLQIYDDESLLYHHPVYLSQISGHPEEWSVATMWSYILSAGWVQVFSSLDM